MTTTLFVKGKKTTITLLYNVHSTVYTVIQFILVLLYIFYTVVRFMALTTLAVICYPYPTGQPHPPYMESRWFSPYWRVHFFRHPQWRQVPVFIWQI